MFLLDFTFIQSGMLAFVLAAVSPAVIVPQMLELKELGFGKNKEVPTLILAGSSIDDVFAITFFGAFVSMNTPGSEKSLISQLLGIPISIFTGVLIGGILGYILVLLFRHFDIRDTKKIMVFMILAIGFHHFEELEIIPVASLLGIMTIGFVILELYPKVARDLAMRFNKIWVLAEVLLFTMIGAVVKLSAIKGGFFILLLVIVVGLVGRSLGVWVALIRSGLNRKEKVFCTIAYWPKATVQAAIGGVPLALDLPHGDEILAIAVLSIVFTAPLGAIGVRFSSERLLEKADSKSTV
jgi:NhaP-type Na+/H+ or K+/H+ antiporter